MTSFPNNYSKAFLEMGRVIHALIMREMLTRFGERRLGYLWALFEPLTHLAFFTLIRMAMDWQAPYDTTTYTFLITGILPFFLFRNCVQKISTAISANKALMVIQQVKPLDIFLARGLLEIATYAVTTVLILSLIHFYVEGVGQISDPARCLLYFLLFGLLGIGIGLIVGPLASLFPVVGTIVNITMRIMYLASGVLFTIDSRIPQKYISILVLNPVTHLLELLRASFFPVYSENVLFLDLNYVLMFTGVTWVIGIILTRKMMKWIMER